MKLLPTRPPAWLTPDTRAGEVLRRAAGGLCREIGKALLLALGCALLAVAVNSLRGKARGGIDFFARAPYDLYTDCPEMEANLPRVTVKALHRGRGHTVILDARPAERYLAGHLPGAQSMPMYGTRPNAPRGLGWLKEKRGRFVVVYGKDEMQSALHLASYLKQNGIRGVHLLKGDLEAWTQAGHRLVPTPLPSLPATEARQPKELVFVDARSAPRFAEGRIPGALSVPFNGLVPPPAETFARLLTERRPLVIYGLEAEDAELADPDAPTKPKDVGRLLGAELLALGAKNVRWLPGGLEAWSAAGGPLETGAPGGRPSDGAEKTKGTGAPAGRPSNGAELTKGSKGTGAADGGATP